MALLRVAAINLRSTDIPYEIAREVNTFHRIRAQFYHIISIISLVSATIKTLHWSLNWRTYSKGKGIKIMWHVKFFKNG
jgi:hypothetical protein